MSVEQLTIDQASEVAVPRSALTPAGKWARFVTDNPHAQSEIVLTAAELLDQGKKATIAVVWEELRYRVHTAGEPYRWDNSLRAPCAAWLREKWPHLAVHMRTRKASR